MGKQVVLGHQEPRDYQVREVHQVSLEIEDLWAYQVCLGPKAQLVLLVNLA